MFKILSRVEFHAWRGSLLPSLSVGILLTGDRLACVDEVLAFEGEILGVATIAPQGDEASGVPTIVALYVLPQHRRRGIGRALMEATVWRCRERGFERVRVDVMSAYIMRIIGSLPAELQVVLEVHDLGDLMDNF